jgi:hypothetical protein
MEMIVNLQGEDDFEANNSIDQLVQLVQKGQDLVDSNIANDYMDEDSIVIVDSNDIESKVVKIGDAQNSANEILSFMASHGSQGFTTIELSMMERISDKLT